MQPGYRVHEFASDIPFCERCGILKEAASEAGSRCYEPTRESSSRIAVGLMAKRRLLKMELNLVKGL